MQSDMKLDHMALYVFDLEQAKDFFIRYFNATANNMYHNPRTGLKTYFLSFTDGARLEIMQRPDLIPTPFEQLRQGYIHIAFSVGSKDNVDILTRRLEQDGYKIFSGPRATGDGYYESCVQGFENNLIEITE